MILLRRLLIILLVICSGRQVVAATDITTLSGKKYFDVHDVMVRGNFLTFTTATEIIRIPLKDVPQDLKERYAPKSTPSPATSVVEATPAVVPAEKSPTTPHELVVSAGNRCVRQIAQNVETLPQSGPVVLSAAAAFSADKIDEARKDALINGKPLAFFLVSEAFYDQPADPNKVGATGAFVQFFQVFKGAVTPVFIVPGRDSAKLPPAVAEAVQKPAMLPVPRVIFTNADTSRALYDLSLPSEKSTLSQRQEAVLAAVVAIKRWYIDVANATH